MKTLLSSDKILTPSLGVPGQVLVDNYGTRLVFLCHQMIESENDLVQIFQKLSIPSTVNRIILKAVTSFGPEIGKVIGATGLSIETCVPFDGPDGNPAFWIVAGLNYRERFRNLLLETRLKAFISKIILNPRYAPQTGVELLKFSLTSMPDIRNLRMILITPSSFYFYQKQLARLYAIVFRQYPYNILNLIEHTSEENIFLAAISEDSRGEHVIGCLGFETVLIDGIAISEISDMAIQPGCRGFNTVLHRYLMQWLASHSLIPDLLFSETRISQKGASLKAHCFAGRELHPEMILPWHTVIQSSIDPGDTILLSGNENNAFCVENMAMTSLTRAQLIHCLNRFGEIPLC